MSPPTQLHARLDADMKDAMRARDKALVGCLRQVRAKVQAQCNAQPQAVDGPPPDALVEQVIAAYVKSLRKAIAEMAAAGERTAQLRQQYAAECDALQRYLPTQLGAEQVQAAATKVAAELKMQSSKDRGRLLGELMRRHPKAIDPAIARPLIEQLLP